MCHEYGAPAPMTVGAGAPCAFEVSEAVARRGGGDLSGQTVDLDRGQQPRAYINSWDVDADFFRKEGMGPLGELPYWKIIHVPHDYYQLGDDDRELVTQVKGNRKGQVKRKYGALIKTSHQQKHEEKMLAVRRNIRTLVEKEGSAAATTKKKQKELSIYQSRELKRKDLDAIEDLHVSRH